VKVGHIKTRPGNPQPGQTAFRHHNEAGGLPIVPSRLPYSD
jgi:hypothetical protein